VAVTRCVEPSPTCGAGPNGQSLYPSTGTTTLGSGPGAREDLVAEHFGQTIDPVTVCSPRVRSGLYSRPTVGSRNPIANDEAPNGLLKKLVWLC
jgi:hypothetical protein